MLSEIILSVALIATEPQFTFLEKGEPAPFDGTLFDPSASVVLSLRPEEMKQICALETKHEIEILTAKCSLEKDLLTIKSESLTEQHTEILAIKDSQITRYKELLEDKKSYNKWFYFAGGVVLGGFTIYKIDKMVNK